MLLLSIYVHMQKYFTLDIICLEHESLLFMYTELQQNETGHYTLDVIVWRILATTTVEPRTTIFDISRRKNIPLKPLFPKMP